MLPTAGLFLPNTLHRRYDTAQEDVETQSVIRRPFGGKPKLFDRKSIDRKSAASTRKSSEDVNSGFSSLSTVSKFIDFTLSRNDNVSGDSQVFVNLIHRVRHDLVEAIRLRACPAVVSYYELYPDKLERIDQTMLDVEKALNDIGGYMENVRVAGDNGGVVGLKHKFEWVLSHQQKLQTRQSLLSVCHHSLMGTIPLMQQLEMSGVHGSFELHGTMPSDIEAPNRPWLYDEGGGSVLHDSQKWRYNQRNLSLPSIMVSEHEGEKLETQSINDIFVELPGSTPDDLPDPDNWDLYAPPTMSQECFEHSIPQRPVAQLRSYKSSDQSQPIASFYEARSRESFNQARPRAFSDQVRPRTSADQIRLRPSLEEYKSRPSFDHISPLPMLVEKVVRNDSSASISDAATISLQAKRHRSRAVDVRKPPTKHSSLPFETQLPYIPAQSSLIMELSQWVLPGPRANGVSNTMYDTHSTSVTSSPVVPASPASLPEVSRPVASVKSITTVPTFTSPTASTNVLPSPNVTSPLNYSAPYLPLTKPASHATSMTPSPASSEAQKGPPSSIRSSTSITRRPVPLTTSSRAMSFTESNPQQPNAAITPPLECPMVDHTQSKSEESYPEESMPKASLASDTVFQETTPVAVALELATGVRPTIPDDLSHTTISYHGDTTAVTDAPAEIHTASDVDQPTPKSLAIDVSIPAVPGMKDSTASVVEVDGHQPVIAQSKRRAAHARRMRLAYGSG